LGGDPGQYRSSRWLDVNRRTTFGAAMGELTARLEGILRRYATTYKDPQLRRQFRADLELLIGEYGYEAVDSALDEVPDPPSQILCIDSRLLIGPQICRLLSTATGFPTAGAA
jgi:hypothetical protein